MKTTFKIGLILGFIGIVNTCLAQFNFKDFKGGFKVGKTMKIYGHEITKIDGEKYGTLDVRYTNITFNDKMDVEKFLSEKAEREMWSEEQKKEQKVFLASISGIIWLHIGRYSVEAGNTKNFTLIIKDATGNEIFRQPWEENIPDLPYYNGDVWRNNRPAYLTCKLSFPFDVFIIDSANSKFPKTHFRILN